MGCLQKYLVLLALLVLLVDSGYAVKCYACTKCPDPFNSTGVLTANCKGDCMKLKYKEQTQRNCYSEEFDIVNEDYIFKCDSDLCNNAGSPVITFFLMGVCSLALFLRNY